MRVPGEIDADREARCIAALQTLPRGTEYSGNALPRRVWTVLAENLPRGSLRPLLLRHPDIFRVDGAPAQWTFQVKQGGHGGLNLMLDFLPGVSHITDLGMTGSEHAN